MTSTSNDRTNQVYVGLCVQWMDKCPTKEYRPTILSQMTIYWTAVFLILSSGRWTKIA